jgi:hypothetical protein
LWLNRQSLHDCSADTAPYSLCPSPFCLPKRTQVKYEANVYLFRHAALPAAVATGLQYSQAHTFLPVHLPTMNAVPTVLWMMAPVLMLDLWLWNVAPHMNLSTGAQNGLHQYQMQTAEKHRHQCMRLPPIQHNFCRIALSMGRQFLLALSMPGVLDSRSCESAWDCTLYLPSCTSLVAVSHT